MNFTPLPVSHSVKETSSLLPISTKNIYSDEKRIKKSSRIDKIIRSVPVSTRSLSLLLISSLIAISCILLITHTFSLLDLSSTLNPAPEYTGQPFTPIESFISMRTRPYASLTFDKPSLSGRTVIPGDTGVSFVVILCATYMFLVILALLYLVFVYEAPNMDKKGSKSDSEDSESESDADSKDENLRMYKQMVKNKRQSLRTRRSDPGADRSQ